MHPTQGCGAFPGSDTHWSQKARQQSRHILLATAAGMNNGMRQRSLATMPEAGMVSVSPLVRDAPSRKFVFLSFRPFANDFRRYLMQALQEAGHPCAHVLLKRQGMEIRTGHAFETIMPVASLTELSLNIAMFFGSDRDSGRGVIVNSAGNSAPDVILRLWSGLREHIWIYDVFDQLRYDAHGMRRFKWWLTDRAYRMTASGCCLLSSDLKAQYKTAFHLDNASHIVPPSQRRVFDGRVVVTASFDRRTDFALLDALARAMPDITIDLHGAVYDNEPETVTEIDRLIATRRNVRYHGRFDMDRIGELLVDYAVGLVPYRTDFAMTRFINPDKMFHYLCAGLEVIASPIPATRRFAPYIHEASNAEAAATALRDIRDGGARRNPGDFHDSFNWHVRAREFSAFAEGLASGDERVPG
jgi:hypothetical protein